MREAKTACRRPRPSRGRRAIFRTAAVLSLGTLIAGGWTLRPLVLERWHISRLSSLDERVRRDAIRALSALSSVRAVRPMLRAVEPEVSAEGGGLDHVEIYGVSDLLPADPAGSIVAEELMACLETFIAGRAVPGFSRWMEYRDGMLTVVACTKRHRLVRATLTRLRRGTLGEIHAYLERLGPSALEHLEAAGEDPEETDAVRAFARLELERLRASATGAAGGI